MEHIITKPSQFVLFFQSCYSNYHKLYGLQQQKFVLSQLWKLELQIKSILASWSPHSVLRLWEESSFLSGIYGSQSCRCSLLKSARPTSASFSTYHSLCLYLSGSSCLGIPAIVYQGQPSSRHDHIVGLITSELLVPTKVLRDSGKEVVWGRYCWTQNRACECSTREPDTVLSTTHVEFRKPIQCVSQGRCECGQTHLSCHSVKSLDTHAWGKTENYISRILRDCLFCSCSVSSW